MKSTLIITTRNEIEGVTTLFPRLPLSAFDEVLAIDLNSTDGTLDFYKKNNIRVIPQITPGRGNAIRLAAANATGDVMVFFAPDGNENPDDLLKLRDLIIAGNDMVIASRFLPGARNEEDVSWYRPRAWANKAFTLSVKLFWGGTITDTINGYRSIRKDKLLELNTDEPGFAIEFQMSIRSRKLKFKVVEIPTVEGDRIGGHSNAYTLPTGWRVLRTLLKEIWLGQRFVIDRLQPR